MKSGGGSSGSSGDGRTMDASQLLLLGLEILEPLLLGRLFGAEGYGVHRTGHDYLKIKFSVDLDHTATATAEDVAKGFSFRTMSRRRRRYALPSYWWRPSGARNRRPLSSFMVDDDGRLFAFVCCFLSKPSDAVRLLRLVVARWKQNTIREADQK